MSASVLGQFGDEVVVSGAAWLADGESKKLTIGNLSANILCKRHNEALSPLDTEAGNFFSKLRQISEDLSRTTLSRKARVHLISGEMLELWMLKLACGLYFGGGSVERVKLKDHYRINLRKIERAFFSGGWDHAAGLYVLANVGRLMVVEEQAQAGPWVHRSSMRMVGALSTLRGLGVECIFDTEDLPVESAPAYVHRPTELIWHSGPRKHVVLLSWPLGTPLRRIRMAYGGMAPVESYRLQNLDL